MTLLALLISTDDSACEVLGRVLPASGIAVERFSDLATAMDRIRQQRFDALIIDFEDAKAAAEVFEEAQKLNSGVAPVTVALVAERAKVRDILSSGAHFVLYKPLSEEKAKAGLRAVSALLNRERRRAYRVPVQAPVELTLPDKRTHGGNSSRPERDRYGCSDRRTPGSGGVAEIPLSRCPMHHWKLTLTGK